MSRRRFVISDTHFGHKVLAEPRGFASVDDMNQAMIDRWCDTVSAEDRVYHLGDVVMNRRYLDIIPHLPGRKVLIKGNHDGFKLKDYMDAGFEDIRACVVRPGYILTHIPVHESELRRFGLNIHGHLHADLVRKTVFGQWTAGQVMPAHEPYVNVSVEQTNYGPVDLDQLLAKASGLSSTPF